jgi:hypothetical protein
MGLKPILNAVVLMAMTDTKVAKTKADADVTRWEDETLQKVLDKTPERKEKFEGVSLEPVERLYTEADADGHRVGFPGEYPYKRGIHPTGYRGSSGRCASLPVSRRPRTRTLDSST